MKKRDLKIMWSSNGPHTYSGYGTETKDLLFRFAKDGWPVANIAFWGLSGSPITLDGEYTGFAGAKIKMYPKMEDAWGADALVAHSSNYGANVVFTMQDVWPLQPELLSQLKYWIPYVPIDKDPCPPGVLDKLRYAYKIVTFSKFGQETLLKHGFTSTLIVEGTDTNIFKPMDRAKVREEIKLPQDKFFFLMVAANKENPPRKGFQEALEAFKMFADKHSDAMIIFSCQQPAPGGFPIREYASYLGIADRLVFVADYKAIYDGDSNYIAKLMNASNVLLHPSQTEGFGLTIIEAQSCGIPVIVNNTNSMPELVVDGVTGEICEREERGRWTNDLSFVYPAKVASLYEKMETLYTKLQKGEAKIKVDTRNHILANYDVNKLYDTKWKPFLEDLQEELLTNPEKIDTIAKAK